MEEMIGDSAISEEALRQLAQRTEALGLETRRFFEGDTILRLGELNDNLYVILEGRAGLYRTNEDGEKIEVDSLSRGSFLGILSFWTQTPTFAESQALSDLECLCIDRKAFDELVETDDAFARHVQHLAIFNLTNRYRRLVAVNLKVDKLTHDLEKERNDLRDSLEELATTRNQLVHQEKLATMGQLLAGIAHEINNPGSVLFKNVETLMSQVPELFASGAPLHSHHTERELLQLGLESPFWDGGTIRERMRDLSARFPGLKRPLKRRLAQLDGRSLELIEETLEKAAQSEEHGAELEGMLRFFEIGVYLRGIESSTRRIVSLVKSLKNYSRQNQATRERVDLRECIQDTLIVLNNRLRHFELKIDLAEMDLVNCFPGEISQIITNVLVNACDATEPEGAITVISGMEEGMGFIRITDSGRGIPPRLLQRVFEPNFSTKNQRGEFGLGLGLAISREIAEKHNGSLTAANVPGGGAQFTLKLPLE